MIDVHLAPAAAAQDTRLVAELTALVNRVYEVAEEGMWKAGTTRTTDAEISDAIAGGQIATASVGQAVAGVVRIQRLGSGEGEFGMLAADGAYRGRGVGSRLVRFAEDWARELSLDVMKLEIVVPRQWSQPSKEFLKAWYGRIDYRRVGIGPFEQSYPQHAPRLATPCDVVVYQKRMSAGRPQV